MVVCRNWNGSPGSCKFGDRCRFEHPQLNRGFSSSNTFAPLQRDNSNTRNSNGYQTGASNARTLPFQLDKNQIIADLSGEIPQWTLSAYGPGRNAPEQLFGGPVREQSFEEIHLLHRIAERSGNIQQAAQEHQQLVQQSQQQIQAALNNIDGAIDYILNAEKNHPNRIDIVRDSNSGAPQNRNSFAQGNNSNAFQTARPPSNTFGAPSQPAAPAFGAPSVGAGAFGQPSALGQRPSAFGAPSQVFGAPSQLGAGGGAFGQPSALGQKPSPFGAPSGGGFTTFAKAGTTFGQPSHSASSGVFGAPSQPAPSNPFGASSQSATSGAFGAPSQQATSGAFGAPPSTAPANPFGGTSSTPFGAPSPASKNVFGAPSGQMPGAAPFGATSPATKNPFGASSQPMPPFGGTTAPKTNPFASTPAANPFGNPQPNSPAPENPFGAPSNGVKPPNSNPFVNPAPAASAASPSYKPVSFGDAGQHPPLNSYATVQPNGRLTMFKGRQVIYRNGEPGFKRNDGSWEKIWFPQGAPPFYGDTEMEDAAYDDQAKAAYMHVRQTGAFEGGVMPMLPPKREWCLWDF